MLNCIYRWVCKYFVTLFVRIADYTENTEDAEGFSRSLYDIENLLDKHISIMLHYTTQYNDNKIKTVK